MKHKTKIKCKPMNRRKETRSALLVWDVPKSLILEFKRICRIRRVTMKSEVVRILKASIDA